MQLSSHLSAGRKNTPCSCRQLPSPRRPSAEEAIDWAALMRYDFERGAMWPVSTQRRSVDVGIAAGVYWKDVVAHYSWYIYGVHRKGFEADCRENTGRLVIVISLGYPGGNDNLRKGLCCGARGPGQSRQPSVSSNIEYGLRRQPGSIGLYIPRCREWDHIRGVLLLSSKSLPGNPSPPPEDVRFTLFMHVHTCNFISRDYNKVKSRR